MPLVLSLLQMPGILAPTPHTFSRTLENRFEPSGDPNCPNVQIPCPKSSFPGSLTSPNIPGPSFKLPPLEDLAPATSPPVQNLELGLRSPNPYQSLLICVPHSSPDSAFTSLNPRQVSSPGATPHLSCKVHNDYLQERQQLCDPPVLGRGLASLPGASPSGLGTHPAPPRSRAASCDWVESCPPRGADWLGGATSLSPGDG